MDTQHRAYLYLAREIDTERPPFTETDRSYGFQESELSTQSHVDKDKPAKSVYRNRIRERNRIRRKSNKACAFIEFKERVCFKKAGVVQSC